MKRGVFPNNHVQPVVGISFEMEENWGEKLGISVKSSFEIQTTKLCYWTSLIQNIWCSRRLHKRI